MKFTYFECDFTGTQTEIIQDLARFMRSRDITYKDGVFKLCEEKFVSSPVDEPLSVWLIRDILIDRVIQRVRDLKTLEYDGKTFTGTWPQVKQGLEIYLHNSELYVRADGLCTLCGTNSLLPRGASLVGARDSMTTLVIDKCKDLYDEA